MILHSVIVWGASIHNIILGRTIMLKFTDFSSTVYGLIKFHTNTGVATIKAIIRKTHECNQIMTPKKSQEKKRDQEKKNKIKRGNT